MRRFVSHVWETIKANSAASALGICRPGFDRGISANQDAAQPKRQLVL